MKVSLVILTWNQKDRLKACLNSLMTWCAQSIQQHIVVVNGSVDGTEHMIREEFPQVELVAENHNAGVARGRNQGLRRADGDLVILLDDDTVVSSDFVSHAMVEMSIASGIGILGPQLVGEDGVIQPSARTYPSVRNLLGRGLPRITPNSFRRGYLDRYLDAHEPTSVDWVLGACQVIRMDLMRDIGFLDERFFFGYEDVDFCRRATKANWKVVYDPRMTVVHKYQRLSAKGGMSAMKIEHVRSIGRYFLKHGFRW